MEMDLLYTVQRLAEARAATKPPPRPPPRVSLRERTAEALAAAAGLAHEEALLRALYPPPSRAERRAVHLARRELRRRYTRAQAEDACWALLDAGWDPAADLPESDSEEEEDAAVEARAAALNAAARRLWRRHEEGIAATTARYVEGFPVREAVAAPTVARRAPRCRDSGLEMCGRCRRDGRARCSRMMMGRGAGVERREVCERCRRLGEVCEEDEEEGKGEGVMEVVGGRVEVVEKEKFALPMRKTDGGWYAQMEREET